MSEVYTILEDVPTGRKRLHQVARYLQAHWPTPFPVRLRIERIADEHNSVGLTYRTKSGLVIRLDPRMQFGYAFDTLLHEWAHAATWPASAAFEHTQVREGIPIHDPQFGAVYREIIHAFDDGDAMEDSKTKGAAW